MKKIFTCLSLLFCASSFSQSLPELLYYKFDGATTGTKIANYASTPPAGADSATIMGGLTQGPSGKCGNALIGSGNASSTDYLNTGFVTNLPGSWTISMWTSNITASSTLFYIFGDASAGSFRCFTNGVAGANNWILRGTGITDVYVNGGATVAPHLTTFVYDQTAASIYGYLDGVLVNTVAQGGTPSISGAGPFKVMGYASNVGSPAGGLLDEFRIYSHALNATEVMALYNQNITNTVTVTACNSYTVPSGHATYTVSGTYLDTIPRVQCGDSLLTINLTLNNSSSSTTSMTACDSYAWNGATYTVSGTYTTTISNAAGCDSLMTLNLTINNSSSSTTSITACDSYTWNGTTYSVSGTYTNTISNAIGCDSLMTLNLTINNSTSSTTSITACGSYMWNGTTYSVSGTYTNTISNIAGCDSLMTLNLTINNSSSSTTSITACDSYAWNGATYTVSGTYTNTISNTAGCDSMMTLNLTINTSPTVLLSVNPTTVCVNASAYPLTGGTPAGGIYSGNGVSGGIFDPGTAGVGTQLITYTYIDANNCSNSDTASIAVSLCAGINVNNNNSFVKIYPNPFSASTTIHIGNMLNNATLFVFDVQGKKIKQMENISGQSIVLTRDNLPAGVYFIQLMENNKLVFTDKLLIAGE